MNKEILKRLQGAKFPQYITGKVILNPNLSELITACGLGFRTLILHTQFKKTLKKPWEAVPNKKLRPSKKGKSGETPEDAVALLWLELISK
jgi:hypothetical protein